MLKGFAGKILLILFPVMVWGEIINIEGYSEEYGNEELPFTLEYFDLKFSRDFGGKTGYELPPAGADSFPPSSDEYKDKYRGIKGFSLANWQVTCRSSGEELGRQLLRSQAKFQNNLQFGFITERDAGEKWWDFYSCNILYERRNLRWVCGGFSAGWGEGLVLWRNFNWEGHPDAPIAPLKSDFLNGYNSSAENGELSGSGVWYKKGKISLMALYSESRWDASADENGILTIQNSGEHITPSQMENKDRLKEQLGGLRLKLSPFSFLDLGGSVTRAEYSPPFAQKDSIRYTFDFSGGENIIYGSDVKFAWKGIRGSGELAGTAEGGRAVLSRLLISGERTQIEAVWRDLSKDFKNLRGVYPEGNDRGISLGVNTRTWAGGEANLHFNSYHRPWRTYYYEMPPEGYDASAKLQQELENLSISFRIRQTASNPDLSGFFRNQYRLNIDRHFSGLKLRGRGEIIQSHSEGEDYYTGWLISAGFEARIFSGALNFSVSGFDTPDYDCRIYQYEAEVPGMMSVPFYLGTGMALNLKYEHFISQRVMVAGKIGITGYNWRPEGLSEASDRRFSLYINYHLKSSADDE